MANVFHLGAQVTFNDSDLQRAAGIATNKLQGNFNQKPIRIKITDDASAPLGRITAGLGNFDRALDASTKRVVAFGITAGLLAKVEQAFKSLVANTISVQDAFVKINVGLNLSTKSLESFGGEVFNIARNTGKTFDEVAQAAERLARQNLGAAETLKRLSDAMKLSRDAGISSVEAVRSLTAIYNTFRQEGLNTTSILDKLIAVHLKVGTSSQVFADAIERSGEVAQEAGIKFETLVGYITAIERVTGREGAAVGTSITKLAASLNRPEVRGKLTEYGINTVDQQGQPLSGEQIIQNLAAKRQQPGFKGSPAEAEVFQNLVGQRQEQNIIALLDELAKKQGYFNQALNAEADSAGKANAANEKYNVSLKSLSQSIGTTYKQLTSNIGGRTLGPSVAGAASVVETVRSFLSPKNDPNASKLGENIGQGILTGITNVLSGPGLAVVGLILGKSLSKVLAFAGDDLKAMIGINDAATKQAQIQEQVVNVLRMGTDQERAQFLLADEIEKKKLILLNIVERIGQQEAENAKLASSVASSLTSSEEGVLLGGKIKRMSSGYMEAVTAESKDISSGVGGASASAKPIIIPKFNFGNGRVEPVVANTDEYIVRNFAGGGDAIFNKNMVSKYGVPSNAKHLSKGLINHFAAGDFDSQLRTRGEQFVGGNLLKQITKGFNEAPKYGNIEDFYRQTSKLTDIALSGKLNAESSKRLQQQITALIEERLKQEKTAEEKKLIITQEENKTVLEKNLASLKEQKAVIQDYKGLNVEEGTIGPRTLPPYGGGALSATDFAAQRAKQKRLQELRAPLSAEELAAESQTTARQNRGISGGRLIGAAITLPLIEPLITSLITSLFHINTSQGFAGKLLGAGEGALNYGTTGTILGASITKNPYGALIGGIAGALGGGFLGYKGAVAQQNAAITGSFSLRTAIDAVNNLIATLKGVATGQIGARPLEKTAFLGYDARIGENVQNLGAQSRILNYDVSRNGGFTTPAQRSQNILSLYKELGTQAGFPDIENAFGENYTKNRKIVQGQNVLDFAARFLQGRNPGGRYFDLRGNPIRGAVEQGLQYQISASNKPDIVEVAKQIQSTLASSQIGGPSGTYGIHAYGGNANLHNYGLANDTILNRSQHHFLHSASDFVNPNHHDYVGSDDPNRYGRILNDKIQDVFKNVSSGIISPAQRTEAQKDLAKTQAELNIKVNPIKIFFENLGTEQERQIGLDLETIIYDKLSKYFNEQNQRFLTKLNALENKVSANSGTPNPPSPTRASRGLLGIPDQGFGGVGAGGSY